MNETLVETDIWIPVPPEVAFTLVTDPVRLRRWLIIAGTIDVRVGGEVHLVVAPGAHAVGRVTAVEPARRFTYTHGWLGSDEMPPASTTVEVLLDPEAEGTRITVRHHGLPVGYEDMADGWSDFLRRLAHTAAGGHNAHDWAGGGETATAEAVLDSTLFTLLSALRQVDRLDTPTPSTDFTIAALVEHLIDNATWVASTLGIPSSVPSGPDAESRVADALWPLVRLLGSADRPGSVDLGQSVPTETLVQYLSVEFLVHAWDISSGTGASLDASEELIMAVGDHARLTRESIFFQADAYAEAQPVDPGASALDQLLALTGRSTVQGGA